MPLPDKIRSRDMAGKTVILSRDIDTDYDAAVARVLIPKGTRMRVASIGRGMNLEALPGEIRVDKLYVTDVCRANVDVDDGREPEPEAFWTSQEEQNDHLWARCSHCGFTAENYKAVKQGWCSDDYIGVKYRFCPICGKRMGFRGIGQKTGKEADAACPD